MVSFKQNKITNVCKYVYNNAKNIQSDIVRTGKGYINAGKDGWSSRGKLSNNPVNNYAVKTYSAMKSTLKYADKSHIPYLFAITGFCTAIPGGTILGYMVGRGVVNKVPNITSSIKNIFKKGVK